METFLQVSNILVAIAFWLAVIGFLGILALKMAIDRDT